MFLSNLIDILYVCHISLNNIFFFQALYFPCTVHRNVILSVRPNCECNDLRTANLIFIEYDFSGFTNNYNVYRYFQPHITHNLRSIHCLVT